MDWQKKFLQYYRFKYYFHAQHSMTSRIEDRHPHTFCVELYLESKQQEKTVLFSQIQTYVREYLCAYEGKTLNELEAFADKIPTLEAMGEHLYETMKLQMKEWHWNLIQLDICENPLRVYSISDQILLCSAQLNYSSRQLERILEKKRRYL
ncbi:6-carboxytetrahydropterin synthase [Anaerosporobacter faecicola]|uniref:6-carboxytetrahydropterin synthase n=1 Tax=Anaerosporobacter faecicola TaxID=2718714 RepID=UPI001438E46B|nr:6-carboxytetrahydropterin synthase [Anaerosporobacter faecicola]